MVPAAFYESDKVSQRVESIMFDSKSASLLSSAPSLRGLNSKLLPELLARHFSKLVARRLGGGAQDVMKSELALGRIADSYELLAVASRDDSIRSASAFVAATAQQILSREVRPHAELPPMLSRDGVDPAVSAALLFLISAQFADAAEASQFIQENRADGQHVSSLVASIKDLASGRLVPIIGREIPSPSEFARGEMEQQALQLLYIELHVGLRYLARELMQRSNGSNPGESAKSNAMFSKVENLCSGIGEVSSFGVEGMGATYPGPAHLARLLRSAGATLRDFALVNIPAPPGSDIDRWNEWLGDRAKSQPFIWPNHRQLVDDRFYEAGVSAVVVLPTGAGKTTLSTIKIAATLAIGKRVVFLAPTHALVEQLTEDLEQIFPQAWSRVTSDFDLIGKEDDKLPDIEVMTPERCLATIAFDQQRFLDVGLVVFDECHLLSPASGSLRRSVDGMLCILGISTASPEADFLLLSAMVKNSEDIARWMRELTGRVCIAADLLWKPSRQARGVVAYLRRDLSSALDSARKTQKKLDSSKGKVAKGLRSEARKCLKAQPYAIWGLRNNWLDPEEGHQSFTITRLLNDEVHLACSSKGFQITPNANEVGAFVAARAGERGIKSIVFVNNRSHTVSAAKRISQLLSGSVEPTADEQVRWSALSAELGSLEHSVMPGPAIAVPHHGGMFRLERDLAERMYRRESGARSIVATPTLAQGLNLPAELAILAGDRRSDAEGQGRDDLEAHELLNAAARAGRAGHVSNGIVLLIPEPCVAIDRPNQLDPSAEQKLASILPEDDRCVEIYDPLTVLLDRISAGSDLDKDSKYLVNRMLAISGSANTDENHQLFDLRKSLGRFAAAKENESAQFDAKISELIHQMSELIPDNLTQDLALEASQTGLPISVVQGLHARILADLGSLPSTAIDWVRWTFDWFSSDSEIVASFLGAVSPAVRGAVGQLREGDITVTDLSALLPGVIAWMEGRPIREIESELGGELFKVDGTPTVCPRARDLVNSCIPRGLSYAMGVVGQIALKQEAHQVQSSLSIDVLESLGVAVRLGYDRPQKLKFMQKHRNYLSRVQVHEAFRQAEFAF